MDRCEHLRNICWDQEQHLGTTVPVTLVAARRTLLICTCHDRFFMSIGSVIRTEGMSPSAIEAYERARRQPMMLPRRYTRLPESKRHE